MTFSINKVKLMLGEAFDNGNNTSLEFKDDVVNEIIAKYQAETEPAVAAPDTEMRLYKCEELRNMAEGVQFQHITLGPCQIAKKGNTKYMAFSNPGLAPSGFNVDAYPWDHQMKRLN